MARSPRQKMKLLFLLQLLQENTDEQHALSTQELIDRLAANDIHAERKSIYDDIRTLQDFGYDILQVSSRQGGGYYLASREFELPELKLLVDAVQSSRFITTKKSRELIGKLEHMASRHDAGKLQRQVYVAGRIKTENESIYYSIDAIHRAIQENCQIRFPYLDWTLKKELAPRTGGKIYQVSPWALIWRDENYYLVAYDGLSELFKHYRVDKMGRVEVTNLKREGAGQAQKLDMGAYANRTFGMYGGEETVVTMQFPDRLIGVVLDRFGKEADIRPAGEGTGAFRCRVRVAVSGQFFGWLAGIGREAVITAPVEVQSRYQEWLADILRAQSEEEERSNEDQTVKKNGTV